MSPASMSIFQLTGKSSLETSSIRVASSPVIHSDKDPFFFVSDVLDLFAVPYARAPVDEAPKMQAV